MNLLRYLIRVVSRAAFSGSSDANARRQGLDAAAEVGGRVSLERLDGGDRVRLRQLFAPLHDLEKQPLLIDQRAPLRNDLPAVQCDQIFGPPDGILQSLVGLVEAHRLELGKCPLPRRAGGEAIGVQAPLSVEIALIQPAGVDVERALQAEAGKMIDAGRRLYRAAGVAKDAFAGDRAAARPAGGDHSTRGVDIRFVRPPHIEGCRLHSKFPHRLPAGAVPAA